jgi:hypothetical protein
MAADATWTSSTVVVPAAATTTPARSRVFWFTTEYASSVPVKYRS